MNWAEYKQVMRDEWAFYKRNPHFPVMMGTAVILIAAIATGVLK